MLPNKLAGELPFSPEQWARVRVLVEVASKLPSDARAAFLQASCADDAALRDRVGRLATAYERAGAQWAFLERSAGELVAPLLAADGTSAVDQDRVDAELAMQHRLVAKAALLARLNAALAERYHIERELGAGGMATVYLAHDVRHGRQVAIKVLHPELSAVLGAERFLTEIKTTAALQHPHILPLFDSGTADGLLFYVMPPVDGETLRARLAREKQLPVADAVRIASDVAGALNYAHRRGIIHRDIKPENILLHEGRPLVADFGIALAVQSAGAQRITQPGLSLGTPQYMSPEQTTGEQEITARSDVYALGAVTYEMLTGEPPFTGATVQQIVVRMRSEEPRAISAQRKHVPPHVEAAVLTALEKLPADRFESAAEFTRALSDPEFRGTAAARASALAPRRQRMTVMSLGAIAIGLAAVAAWGWSRAPNEPAGVVRFTMTMPRDLGIVTTAATANLAISPDGRVVVFTASALDGTTRLYARTLDQVLPRALAGTEGASQPFFSPDGQWIAFWSGGRLHKVAAAGGVPKTLTGLLEGAGGTWTRRGVIVFSTGVGLHSVPNEGGAPERFAAPDTASGETYMLYPVALPDGDHMLYVGVGREGVALGLASLTTGSSRSLGIPSVSALGVIDGHVIYTARDNVLMAVPFDPTTRRTTGVPVRVATDVNVGAVGTVKAALSLSGTLAYRSEAHASRIVLTNGRDPDEVVLSEPRAYAYPRFSPNGKRLAVSIEGGTRSDVWLYDLASLISTRISSGGSANERPEWTPDGERVLYRSDEGTYSSIWWRPADLSAPATILLAGGVAGIFEGVIAPDGQTIVYQESGKIGIRQLTGNAAPRMIATTAHGGHQARVSPDGRWIAFVTDESGSEQVVVQPLLGTGVRVQVSSKGGSEPVWSRDGRRLFYRANKKFIAATITSAPTFAVASREVILDDNFVTAAAPHANYDVSLDGKRLLVLEAVEDAQLLVVHNWAAEVRARLRSPIDPRN